MSLLGSWVKRLFGNTRSSEDIGETSTESPSQREEGSQTASPGMRYTDVFVPGGFPRHTYNPRLKLNIEEQVRQVLENLCKLVVVTGHTKSGKTVLVRSILPRDEAVWIDGGTVGAEDDFWTSIIDQLNLFQDEEIGNGENSGEEISGAVTAGVDAVVAKAESELGTAISSGRTSSVSRSRSVSSRVAALRGMAETRRPLVIDDFHYLPRGIQGDIVRALKPIIFDGVPVVIIAIPHRRYDALKVEKEMTGRILPVDIPAWSEEELSYIPATGFPLLNGTLSSTLTKTLARESIGSPHLMQEFCRDICRAREIETSFGGTQIDLSDAEIASVFVEAADTIGRPIFEKLARGPRQHSDRKPRTLKNGTHVDIYRLVLHALAHIRPGMVTLEYEELRTAIRDVSLQDPPQLHEIARVLKHMSDIAATDQSSTPVIDFDEEEKRLHVTDPFFAFYLRWGSLDS